MKEGLRVGLTVDMPAKVERHMKPHLQGLVRHPLYATWAMVYHMETASRMLLAPYLRRLGHFTLPDFLGTRYGGVWPRLLGVMSVVLVSFVYVVAV